MAHHTFEFTDENGDQHFVMRHWIHKKPRWSVEANGLYLSYMEDSVEINCFVPAEKGKLLLDGIRNAILDLNEGDGVA
jgi:hypothetical protein